MNPFIANLKIKILSFLLRHLAFVWFKTIKVEGFENSKNQKSAVIGLWHQDLPLCMYLFRKRDILVMISPSRDGQIAAHVAKNWGYRVIAGSSSRQNTGALKKLLRLKNLGTSYGMALDGPRGPAKIAKPGAEWLASQLKIPFVRIELRYTRSITLNTWDRSCLPLPFSRVYCDFRVVEG